jgi:DNA replication and repair protein RecF
MFLQRLAIHGLRNLEHVDIQLSAGPNFFFGENGSGKTSLLEGVYLLSRGRSFRHRNLKTVINHQLEECTCFGALKDVADPYYQGAVGVTRKRQGDFVFKVNGEQVHTASKLAEALPVQLINSETFQLLEGSPSYRRGFLDWGVFHVEHNYRELWARYLRCLKHRNSLLRHGRIDDLEMAVWNREFTQLAREVTAYRKSYLEQLIPVLDRVVERLGLVRGWEFQFYAGWDDGSSLEELLQRNQERDRKVGFTQAGPHRAELKILVDKRLASEVLSRGQTKILVSALKIAQGFLFRDRVNKQCIYLLDDLPAELDAQHRQKVSELLLDLGVQVLITGVDKQELLKAWPDAGDNNKGLFHVKQGAVTESNV